MTSSDLVLAVVIIAVSAALGHALVIARAEMERHWVRAPRPPTFASECHGKGGVTVATGRYGGQLICLTPEAFVDMRKDEPR